jgi:competence protein ComEA
MKKILTLLAAAFASAALSLAGTAALAQKTEAKKSDAAPAGTLIDVNSASEAELATLPGIGEARAKAIVKGRPYKGKNELRDRKIVPSNVYNDIQGRIIAKQDGAAPRRDEKKK